MGLLLLPGGLCGQLGWVDLLVLSKYCDTKPTNTHNSKGGEDVKAWSQSESTFSENYRKSVTVDFPGRRCPTPVWVCDDVMCDN